MWRVLGAFLLFGLIVTAIKIALIFLILAGLIFRTKETVSILLMLGALSLITHFPWVTLGLLGLVAIVAIYRAMRKPDIPELPPPSHTIEP